MARINSPDLDKDLRIEERRCKLDSKVLKDAIFTV
jgi:hypothetical protein